MALSDELAQRRLAQFEARHGARLVEFAAAASLPVVLDPRLVHLLRINFFVDGEQPLPWTAESDLLFSPLCTDLDDGLFEIEPTVRAALLGRLQRDGGPARIRDIASLLWAYLHQRPVPWAHEPGLERAQELTALQVLDPHACEVWLERAQAAVDRDVRAERPWFVAIQRKLQPWRDLLDRRDRARALRARLDAIVAECVALRSLDFLDDVQPPLRQEVDIALAELRNIESFVLLGRTISDGRLPEVVARVDEAETWLMQARFVLLYSALLRLSFEPLVKKARDAGWGRRRFREVIISGDDGLAHRWLAARLYEERSGSGGSAVFLIRNSTGGGWGERLRSFLGQSQQEIVLQLDRFDPGVVERWVLLLLEKAGRSLPQFVWSASASQDQILFKLAGWLGLDEELLSQRLARVPIQFDEAVGPLTAPAQPAGRARARSVFPAQGRNVFAAIGISRYQHWESLRNPVEDAVRVTALFQKLGFELAAQLLDEAATCEAMYRLVTDDLMAFGSEDSLVLFYAGHAATRKYSLQDRVVRHGYLIPADARPKDVLDGWIDLETWLRAVSVLPAKHILVILDVCGTGVAMAPALKWRDRGFDSSALTRSQMTRLRERASRRVITSGLEDQEMLEGGPVQGCSLFTGCLIEALEGGLASRPGRAPYVTGSELGLYLQRQVTAYPNSRQTPDFGAFSLDERGELFIPLLPR